MKKLIRNGIEGIFSDADWKSGQPQRYGWQEPGQERKELPKEIIQFIERRRPAAEVESVKAELDAIALPEVVELETVTGKKITIKSERLVKPKTKKNDNPKQKDGGAAKRKPGRVAKN